MSVYVYLFILLQSSVPVHGGMPVCYDAWITEEGAHIKLSWSPPKKTSEEQPVPSPCKIEAKSKHASKAKVVSKKLLSKKKKHMA